MKIVTASNGKQTVKMSKTEWQNIGKKAGWVGGQQLPPPPAQINVSKNPANGSSIDLGALSKQVAS